MSPRLLFSIPPRCFATCRFSTSLFPRICYSSLLHIIATNPFITSSDPAIHFNFSVICVIIRFKYLFLVDPVIDTPSNTVLCSLSDRFFLNQNICRFVSKSSIGKSSVCTVRKAYAASISPRKKNCSRCKHCT